MKPLNNYLATYRRRLNLHQGDLAGLVGLKTRAIVSNLERGHVPRLLRTLLAIEGVLGAPIADLFAGERLRVLDAVRQNASHLSKRIAVSTTHGAVDRRRIAAVQSFANASYQPEVPGERPRSERVLSIDPGRAGIGYAALETEPRLLVGWGTRACRSGDRSALDAVKDLIIKYQPTRLVLPDWRSAPHPHRKRALETFIDALAEVLTLPTLPVLTCTGDQLRQHFTRLGAHTKQEIAELLAVQFRELRPLVPKKRRIWETERPILSVFDALAMALALTHLAGQLPDMRPQLP